MIPTRIDAASYGAAAGALSGASRGTYSGPAVSEDVLRDALGSVTGLDTSVLASSFSQASGDSQPGQLNNRLAPVVIKILGEVALGLIGSLVGNVVGDWVNRREETKNLEEQAKDASDAVDTVVEDADKAMSEVLNRAMQLLDMLLKYISGIDPTKFPDEFRAAVRCAAEIIDNAADMILGTCEQRDEIIEGCYGQLISETEKICGEPAAELPPEVQEHTKEIAPGEAPSGGSSSTTPTGPSVKAQECPPEENPSPAPKPEPVTQPSGTLQPEVKEPEVKEPEPQTPEAECPPEVKEPEPQTPALPPNPVTTPSGLTPEVTSDPVPEPELPTEVEEEPVEEPVEAPTEEPVEEPEPVESCGDICGGILGLVGVGVALLALGALVECLAEMEIPAVELPPEPAPVPAPVPLVVEETPVPVPSPEELAEVPEPTPPPKKVAFTEAQQVAAAPPPAPPAVAVPVSAPQPAPMSSAVGAARKAGAW